MGRYDFACNCRAELIGYDGYSDTLRVHCYWKCNGWRYDMSPVYGWVTCNGEERLVANGIHVNFQNNQGEYELGYSDYRINRQQSNINVSYSARLRSDSSYTSGERWSGTGTHTVGALASHTVYYNANGGTGAPGNQTKWYGSTLILSSTRPTRTGYTFQGWATSAGGGVAYQPGGQYGADSDVTLYAVWKANTWTVTYNANGGIGAPASQIKTYGQTLKLSTTKPTKVDYNFLGWATSADGPVAYQPGGNYTANANVTLYAKWELAYVRPRINDLSIYRCKSDGTASESGTYLRLDFKWATDLTGVYAKLQYKKQTATTWTTVSIFDNSSATSGTITKKVLGGNAISAEESWTARIYIYDSKGTSYATYSSEFSIGTVAYPIDVRKGGTGIAFGKVAESDDLFDVNFDVIFRKDAQANIKVVSKCGSNSSSSNGWYKVASQTMSGYGNTNILFYIRAGYSRRYYGLLDLEIRSSGNNISCWALEWIVRSGFAVDHVRIVISGMTWTLYVYNPSGQYGRVYFSEIQGRNINGEKYSWPINYFNSDVKETATPTSSVKTTDGPIQLKPRILYDNSSGTNGTVTLSQNVNDFSYIEIFYNDGTGYGTCQHSVKIYGNKRVGLFSLLPADDSKMAIRYCTVQASVYNTSITMEHGSAGWLRGDYSDWWNIKEIKITRVIGYL